MTRAYDEAYLGKARTVLARMLDFAGYDLKYDIEKFFQLQAAFFIPPFQFLFRRIFRLDIPLLIGDLMSLQPFFRFLACTAFWIMNK